MAKRILKGVGKLALGTVGAALGVGGKKKEKAPPPGPVVMPLADDEAVVKARKRSIAEQMKRGGRTSTILTDGTGNSLGG